MIGGLEREQFVEILQNYLCPTAPIQSEEHLHGRGAQLREIQQALCSFGRSIFIYGDRGVGKTSLAQTVAYAHQSSMHEPVILACSPQSTFSSILGHAIRHLVGPPNPITTTSSTKLNFVALSHEFGRSQSLEPSSLPESLDLNAASAALIRASSARTGQTVVIVDEFDRITSEVERTKFADFIKQLGDQRLEIRFVFCGVAESLEKLLGSHESCYRYIAGIELPRLSWDARWDIIDNTAKALGVSVGDHPRFRIAAISDGFPHYVHLVCEKLFWEMFNDPIDYQMPTVEHYRNAVAAAVLGIEQHLKRSYERATMKDVSDYEEVLWAVADHADLVRNSDSIFDSYCSIAKKMDSQPLDRARFGMRLGALKPRPVAGY
jgi:uncharacterized protein